MAMNNKQQQRKIQNYRKLIGFLSQRQMSLTELSRAMETTSNYSDAMAELKQKGYVRQVDSIYNPETKHYTYQFIAVPGMPEYDEPPIEPVSVESAPEEVKPWMRLVTFAENINGKKNPLNKKLIETDKKTRNERKEKNRNPVFIRSHLGMIA